MKNKIDDGGPVLPEHSNNCFHGSYVEHIGGMSLRDYFAGQVIAALFTKFPGLSEYETKAKYAYRMADAMIEQKRKLDETE